MRLLPWVSRREHRDVLATLDSVVETVKQLEKQIAAHQALVGKELHKIKYSRPSAECNLPDPLTPEQEEIVKEFNENKKLPEQIRRDFARGGEINATAGMLAALGRFGERGPDFAQACRDFNLGKPFGPPGDVYAYEPDDADAPRTIPTTRVDLTFSNPESANAETLRKHITDTLNSMPRQRLGSWPKRMNPIPPPPNFDGQNGNGYQPVRTTTPEQDAAARPPKER